ncbi:MAG: hypothetical protein SFZ02_13890 [bacterium]|nr:hypothetical protein [bacterium]
MSEELEYLEVLIWKSNSKVLGATYIRNGERQEASQWRNRDWADVEWAGWQRESTVGNNADEIAIRYRRIVGTGKQI